jgi:hypothetical protein
MRRAGVQTTVLASSALRASLSSLLLVSYVLSEIPVRNMAMNSNRVSGHVARIGENSARNGNLEVPV